jgi:chromosome segregation ATPase
MSLQLKLESFQSNASETRGMNADLSEKLGDSQREIFRLKTSIEELQHTVENTNRDLARSEERVAALGKEKRQLQEEVQHLQEERAEMESSASDKLQQQESSFETAMQQQESSYEAAIAAMQTELQSSQTERDNLQSQLKSLDENNANFVEYKNRAQLAIKKVSIAQ